MYDDEEVAKNKCYFESFLSTHRQNDNHFAFLRDSNTNENALKYKDSSCADTTGA